MIGKGIFDGTLGSIHATLFWESEHSGQKRAAHEPPPRFITVSRQAGAEGESVAQLLADQLTAADPGPRPWSVWDRALVEKIAAEQHIPQSAIEALEKPRSWLDELLTGLSLAKDAEADQFQVFRRVVATARALALAGRAILVGRGGVYATRDIPGGVHIRLVAPTEFRIANFARSHGLDESEAARQVQRIDQEREVFHRRYWGGKALLPEIFTVTFNTADVCDQRLVASVLPLVLPAKWARPVEPVEKVEAACAAAGK